MQNHAEVCRAGGETDIISVISGIRNLVDYNSKIVKVVQGQIASTVYLLECSVLRLWRLKSKERVYSQTLHEKKRRRERVLQNYRLLITIGSFILSFSLFTLYLFKS